jgi:hypothetical protein
MLKKLLFAVFGLAIAVGLSFPPKAEAQVAVGIQVGVPVVAFTSGYHEGYYYENGYRYQRDARGYRHYDHAYGGHRDWAHDRGWQPPRRASPGWRPPRLEIAEITTTGTPWPHRDKAVKASSSLPTYEKMPRTSHVGYQWRDSGTFLFGRLTMLVEVSLTLPNSKPRATLSTNPPRYRPMHGRSCLHEDCCATRRAFQKERQAR